MSEDGKRSNGHRPQATAPILDSTKFRFGSGRARRLYRPSSGVSLFGDFERAADFNAAVTDHTFIRLATAEGRVPASFASTASVERA